MANQKEFLYEDSTYLLSLSRLVGKKVVDIVGYPSDPFGGTPLFKVYQIVFLQKFIEEEESEE